MSTDIEEKVDSLELMKVFAWHTPLDTCFINNQVVNAMRGLGIEGFVSEFLDGTKKLNLKLSWRVAPNLVLLRHLDAIENFSANVEKYRSLLDREVWFASSDLDESKLYFNIRAVDNPSSDCPRKFFFNAYYVALQKLFILKTDLERAKSRYKEPIRQILEMWKVLIWHDKTDPNIRLINPLWAYAEEAQREREKT